MRTLMILILCLTGAHVAAQSDIDRLLDRNIFDPDRGKKPEQEGEAPDEVEVPVVAKDMPILDGTLIVGETRIALFTHVVDGETISASVGINESVAGYTVQDITTEGVTLKAGGAPFELQLFSGQKENRGGSRAVASARRSGAGAGGNQPVNAAQLRNRQQQDQRGENANNQPNRPTRQLPNARNNQQQGNQRFNRRTPPNRNNQRDSNSNELGKKF